MAEKKKKSTKKKRKHQAKSIATKKPAASTTVEKEIVVQAVSTAEEKVPVTDDKQGAQLWSWLWPLINTTVLMALALVLIGAGVYYGFERFYQDKVLPNTYVGSIPVAGLSYEQAEQSLRQNFATLTQKDLNFIVDGSTYTIPVMGSGITYDFDRVLQELKLRKRHDVWGALFLPTRIETGLRVNSTILTETLQSNIPSIAQPPKNASVYLAQDTQNKPYFAIIPAESHRTADFATIVTTVTTMLEQGHALPVIVKTFEGTPEISDEEAYAAIKESEKWLKKTVTIAYEHQAKKVKAEIAPAKDWQWLEFDPKDGKLQVAMNYIKWQDLIGNTILPAIEQAKEDVMVELPANNSKYAVVSGTLRDGYTVDQFRARDLVEEAFRSEGEENKVVTLPVLYQPASFISSSGIDLGLKDVLGVGHSNFAGSSSARIFNVKKGLAIYNNLLLAPGDKLSFNSLLGNVTVSEGWKEELVIKEGGKKTVPEAGGGLCQVSTTMYRALVLGGLDVLERRAHSYLVSYYVGDNDPMSGIDATIYPGSQDLVFVNDTNNYILIQTDTRGVEAYVRIYGTSDGRKVELTGPNKSGWVAPPAPILAATDSLPPGQVKITKAAHQGRTVKWTQKIIRPDGTEEKNDIVSVYKAIPAEGLIGAAASA